MRLGIPSREQCLMRRRSLSMTKSVNSAMDAMFRGYVGHGSLYVRRGSNSAQPRLQRALGNDFRASDALDSLPGAPRCQKGYIAVNRGRSEPALALPSRAGTDVTQHRRSDLVPNFLVV